MKTIKEASAEFCEKRRLESTGYPPDAWFRAGIEFAQRWIPVEEELPTPNLIVICKIKEYAPFVGVYIPENSGFRNISENEGYYRCTHWRPIEYK